MLLRWLTVMMICTLGYGLSQAQEKNFHVSLTLDTIKKAVWVQADIQVQPLLSTNMDTLWFHMPMQAFIDPNSVYAEDLDKMGYTDFYFRSAAMRPTIQDMKIYADGQAVRPYKRRGTDAFLGILTSVVKSVQLNYMLTLPAWHFGPCYKDGDYILQYFYPEPMASTQGAELKPLRYLEAALPARYELYCTTHFPEDLDVYTNGQVLNDSEGNTIYHTDQALNFLLTPKKASYISGTIESEGGQSIPYFIHLNPSVYPNIHEMLNRAFQDIESKLGTFPFSALMLVPTASPYYQSYKDGVMLVPYRDKKEDMASYLLRHLTRLWVAGKFPLQDSKDVFLHQGISAYVVQSISKDQDIQPKVNKSKKHDIWMLREYQNMGILSGLQVPEERLNKSQMYLNREVLSELFIKKLASTTSAAALQSVLKGWDGRVTLCSAASLMSALEEQSGRTIATSVADYLTGNYVLDLPKDSVESCFPIRSFLNRYSDCSGLEAIVYPAYNDNDGWIVGLTLANAKPFTFKPWTWAVSPMYSFQHEKLLGQAWMQYDYLMSKDDHILDRIRVRMGVKSFDMDYNRKFDYTLRYIKLDPTIKIYFKHAYPSNTHSTLTLRWLNIREQRASFADGKFNFLVWNKSNIYQLRYNWNRYETRTNTMATLQAEYQQYGSEKYLKLTGEGSHRWMYKADKSIGMRLFAGGFAVNTQRRINSFQNLLSRGSLALIQHGFNDYTYEEYFMARQSQSGLQDKQVSLVQGGGFKTPVGSSYSIGMSNNFAGSVNLFADVPFNSKWFPLQVYFDVGLYSRFFNQQFSTQTMYNGGFMLNYGDVVQIFVPLVYSEELGNIYREKHKNFLSRISFGINLERLGFWKNLPWEYKKYKAI
ncbi:MAG: hypothetical protein LC107_13230 [Chitinophagales bacterium]|nr:hypothetical protein [Chitinophagales bacterium]